MGYGDNNNLYAYALGDPINLFDPNGREVQSREWTLTVGFWQWSWGSYTASPSDVPLNPQPPWSTRPSNSTERGETFAHGPIWGLELSLMGHSTVCSSCGPEDIEGDNASVGLTVGAVVALGGSYTRNESQGESLPGVGYIRRFEGEEEGSFDYGVGLGLSFGGMEQTTVTERRQIERATERAVGGQVRARSAHDGSVRVTRTETGSRLPQRATCRTENGRTVCN